MAEGWMISFPLKEMLYFQGVLQAHRHRQLIVRGGNLNFLIDSTTGKEKN